MKIIMLLAVFSALSSFAVASDIKNCRVAKETKMRMMDGVIESGSVAVTHGGTPITLEDILGDQLIHFKSKDGKISQSYQWMYSQINQVQNRENKFLSTSYGEDVIITIEYLQDKPGQTTIKYVGTSSGNYLTMTCEIDRPL